jgi:hypothetical protein
MKRAWECDEEIPRIKGTIKMGSEALLGFVYIHHVLSLQRNSFFYIVVRTENLLKPQSAHTCMSLL